MSGSESIPAQMRAAVYRGDQTVRVESIATPAIGPDELLLRVESCGVCHTDLKKIEYNLLPPPRVYGHETAGVVAAVGAQVNRFQVGDRVIAFHHVPCGNCFYCLRQLYAQCPVYKRVGITAGFEPAGGGFAQYVRVMGWIVERGVEKIPPGVSFDQASFVEPLNTCLKAVVQAQPQAEDVVAVLGQGPIGLLFTMLLQRYPVRVVTSDTLARRRALSEQFGAVKSIDPRTGDVAPELKLLTQGRGADIVFVATAAPGLVEQAVQCSRPGAKVVLFAQTSAKERIELSGADICVQERLLFGSYSASIDLQRAAADLVFGGELPLEQLVSHRLPLDDIQEGFAVATRPGPDSLKVVIHPQEGAS